MTLRTKHLALLAILLGIVPILCSVILARSLVRTRTGSEVIHVVGSARRPIRSDFIIWSGTVTKTAPSLSELYAGLNSGIGKLHAYLAAKGVRETELTLSAIAAKTLYAPLKEEGTNSAPADTDREGVFRQVVGYQLSQQIEVRSDRIDTIDRISRQSTEIINSGVNFESGAPLYLYTKMSALKVAMQADAAHDALARAEQIAQSSRCRLGKLRSAHMNTPIITPLYSNAVSDEGVDDTTSLDKKITAIVSADYAIR